jgi:hypothetical protein
MTVKEIVRYARIVERMESLGLKWEVKREILKMTNIRMYRGRLDDATVSYHLVQVLTGNTYAYRDLIKAAGAKWDGKAWKFTGEGKKFTLELMEKICRRAAGK